MYENSTTYTWWDIEDCVGSLAVQAVDRWEALGLPKAAVGQPAVLQVWRTLEGATVYTIALFYGNEEVYTAEGEIKISGVHLRAAAVATESEIVESAASIVGESIANGLTKGLLSWLCQQ